MTEVSRSCPRKRGHPPQPPPLKTQTQTLLIPARPWMADPCLFPQLQLTPLGILATLLYLYTLHSFQPGSGPLPGIISPWRSLLSFHGCSFLPQLEYLFLRDGLLTMSSNTVVLYHITQVVVFHILHTHTHTSAQHGI